MESCGEPYLLLWTLYPHGHTAIVSEAKDDPELVAALSETMYYNMRERLQGDADYDPERFPNAQNFYHPRK